MRPPRRYAVSYVKVEVRSRSPQRWGWSLHRDGGDDLIQRSEGTYGGAEDALRAGKAAQAEFEASVLRCPVHAEKEFAD